MRRFLLLATALIVISPAAKAQTKTPKVEVFGGYSYLNFDLTLDPVAHPGRQSANGAGVNVAGVLNDWFSIVGDFSYDTKQVPIPEFNGTKALANNLYYLAGPRVSARRERTTVFGQVLIGAVHMRADVGSIHSFTDLAFGLGGGLDLNIGNRVAIRAVQFDYLPSRITNDFTKDKVWLHQVRVQTGIVLRF